MLVVDDQHALAEAIRISVELTDGLACAGVAGDIETALRVCRSTPVDVVLMDIELPGVDGIEGTRQIKELFPEIDVYIFTGFGNVDSLAAVASSGASGFFTKSDHLDNVLRALRHPIDQQIVVDPDALVAILADAERGGVGVEPLSLPPLTGREREVLELLGAGLAPQTMARQLGLSVHTVRGHVKSILAKLGVHSQLEAVALAVSQGWIGPHHSTGGADAAAPPRGPSA